MAINKVIIWYISSFLLRSLFCFSFHISCFPFCLSSYFRLHFLLVFSPPVFIVCPALMWFTCISLSIPVSVCFSSSLYQSMLVPKVSNNPQVNLVFVICYYGLFSLPVSRTKTHLCKSTAFVWNPNSFPKRLCRVPVKAELLLSHIST